MSSLVPERGALRAWVELYGPTTEAPEEAHLGAAIALISAAIGWKASIRWSENAEPCTVNVVLEGRSASARKTTVAGSAHGLASAAMSDFDESARNLKTRSISHTSNRGLIEAVAAKDKEQADRWEREPPPGVLLVWDEFGAVLGEPGDTKGAGWLGQVRATVMQLTNGRHGGTQTGGDKLPPARCAVSILATMTRIELEQRVSSGLLRDGFMGRFILIPYTGRKRLLSEPPKWTPGMVEQRDWLVQWIRDLAQSREEIGSVFDRLEPDARDSRTAWYARWVAELEQVAEEKADESSLAAVEAFGRLQTTALKVATVAAVAEWQPPDSLAMLSITREHVEYGQRVAELCLLEVIDLGREGGMHLRDVYAERVKELLARRGSMSKKQLLDSCRMASLSRYERWRVVEDLYPDDVEIVRQDSGGRPRILVALVGAAPDPAQNGGVHA